MRVYRPPQVDRIWGISGSCSNIPKAILYLLKGDYTMKGLDPCLGGPGIVRKCAAKYDCTYLSIC